MTGTVAKITEAQKSQRDNLQLEFRNVIALEQIADTLEAIRAENVGFHLALVKILQARPK